MERTWECEYEAALIALPENPALDAVAEIVWEHGILAHIAPTDEKRRSERKAKERDLWERDDPELYWRILYAARYTVETMRRVWTFSAGYVAWAIVFAASKYPNLFVNGNETIEALTRAIELKAEEEIRRLGQSPHLIPWGAIGCVYSPESADEFPDGIPVTIDGYTGDGKVMLRAEGYKGHCALYTLVKDGGCSPSKLRAELFKSPVIQAP